jgi:probable F420-dependent oxidoreductase
MKIGIHLPQAGAFAGRDTMLRFAQLAEELGFDSLWVSDHVVIPRRSQTLYPASPSGRFPLPPDTPFLEPISTLLFVAACTEKAKLGVSICVIPVRNPVLNAKMLATLDVLSGGRLILGAGAGWWREEFKMLDAPFDSRGPRTSEYLQLMKTLWSEENPFFQGRFYRISDVGFQPKPLQKPHPPIWIGGHAPGALRRAALLGDAWHAAFLPSDEAAALYRQVQAFAREGARDPAGVAFTVRTSVRADDLPSALEHLRAYKEVGVSYAVVEAWAAPERFEEALTRFAQQVLPVLE